MYFPFMNYETFTGSANAGQTNTITTLTYKAYVVVELTRGDINAANEVVRVFADSAGITDFNNEINMLYMSGANNDFTSGGVYTDKNMHVMPVILKAGAAIKVQAVNESNVDVKLHVFRLPDNV